MSKMRENVLSIKVASLLKKKKRNILSVYLHL